MSARRLCPKFWGEQKHRTSVKQIVYRSADLYGGDSSNLFELPSRQEDQDEDKDQQPEHETFVVAAPPAIRPYN